MELVGRTVKKEFLGLGILNGTIKSYDPVFKFFEIDYEDGDSEELELNEVVSILEGEKIDELDEVNFEEISTSLETLEKNECVGIEGIDLNVDISMGEENDSSFDGDLMSGERRRRVEHCFDINLSLEEEIEVEELKVDRQMRGNDDGNGSLGKEKLLTSDVEWKLKVCSGLSERVRGDDCKKNDESLKASGETWLKDSIDLNERVLGDGCLEEDNYSKEVEGAQVKERNSLSEEEEDSCRKRARLSKRLKSIARTMSSTLSSGGSDVVTSENHEDENKACPVPLEKEANTRRKRGRPSKRLKSATQTVSSTTNAGTSDMAFSENHQEDKVSSEPPDKETCNRGKRRRSSGKLNSPKETVLRRSTRRSSASLNNDLNMDESLASNDASLRREINVVLDSNCDGYIEQCDLPPKLELPPSSKNLNIDEIHIMDVFSVYACLRSFSTVLFLSPFSLESFVEALNYSCPNSLIDSVHFSILRALKVHMEFLSDEGSQSATNCLRSLNWALLDVVTWPIYMVEYLLLCGSSLKPGFELSHLKVLIGDYYKQSASLKIEILRCLCDDVIEAEAMRSELNRRAQASELDMDVDRIAKVERKRKRKDQNHQMDDEIASCLTQDVVDETSDWNSDDCCLCKMDGSLICCDGCPAAYHTRCVGITKDTLPDGEWYCPECVINRYNVWMKSPKSLRGSELLGVDPYGRLYFSACGYLLVLDSCDPESSYNFYNVNDLNFVLDVLKSSEILHGSIVNAISMNWGIVEPKGYQNCPVDTESKDLDGNCQISAMTSSSLAPPSSEMTETKDELRHYDASVSESIVKYDLGFVHQVITTRSSIAKCGALAQISKFAECGQTYPEVQGSPRTLSKLENPGEIHSQKNIGAAPSSHASVPTNQGNGVMSQMHSKPDCYVNYYTFGQIAASVARELVRKSPDNVKEDITRSSEEIISSQMRAISTKSTKFCWIHLDANKEDCGWCFFCKNPTESDTCLFNMSSKNPAPDVSKSGAVGVHSKRIKKSHLFLSYVTLFPLRNACLGFCRLESNLRRIALLPEWSKYVDSVVTMGSASHVMTTSVQVSSKHASGRKRTKVTVAESKLASTAAARSSTFWYRGGRLSRQLFNCKGLSHSQASKAGRQGGCKKIQGILYPDGSEFAKRSKYIAWRASVEMSQSVAHLAYQVRELDSNIRWDDLENIQTFSHLSKDSRKTMKLFKKVTIRRKCFEGTYIKYLLDFGKRKAIPDTVICNGIMLEASTSERKKYWVAESLVPLHILKAYEEKKLARISSKMKPGHIDLGGKVSKKSSRKSGLLYLLSKGQLSDYYKCGHCNKDVLIRREFYVQMLLNDLSELNVCCTRDAVNCQDCEGFFHKRHVRKSEHSSAAECTYTCQRCRDEVLVKKIVKSKPKKGKAKAQKSKTAITNGRPKRLARRVKYMPVQRKKIRGAKKRKQGKSRNQQCNKSKKGMCWSKGRRTHVYYSYWRNGLRFTRSPNDGCAVQFRETKLLLPSEHPRSNIILPKCGLCSEASYRSTLIYVNCESCQEWFHGKAFGVTTENSSTILGFRCHNCCKRNPPICPYLLDAQVNEVGLLKGENDAGVECIVTDKFAGNNGTSEEQNTHPELDLTNIDQKIVADPNSFLERQNAVPDIARDKKGLEHSGSYLRKQRMDELSESKRKEHKADGMSGSSCIGMHRMSLRKRTRVTS
ncbi:hypothetical protein IFM89_037596 [Coptis chinensis]|uniref:Uncharacterized protein n=1 Tax=Coptis chinensis TaxID=261450 RepID=A0A835HBB7_9MAGN|nr:hypothetical protein IFM89_037596 [Coptis chinensis]